VNQSQRIVIGIAVFVAVMLVWGASMNFAWWGWGPASSYGWTHHHWGYTPLLVLFIIFAMKRNRRWRDRQDYADDPDRPDRPERPRR